MYNCDVAIAMIRKQVYIEPRHERMLKRRSKELGVSEAELIRRGIEQVAASPATLAPDKQAALERLTAVWEERRRLSEQVPQTGRTWSREEMYTDDERFRRHLG
jgi:hypothetical protein